MSGFPWPGSRVQISNIKASGCAALWAHQGPEGRSRPPVPVYPRQSQYLWTLKMGAPRVRLQDRSRTCHAQDARAFALQRANFGALLRRAAPENGT
jgi:hypothetical protein